MTNTERLAYKQAVRAEIELERLTKEVREAKSRLAGVRDICKHQQHDMTLMQMNHLEAGWKCLDDAVMHISSAMAIQGHATQHK